MKRVMPLIKRLEEVRELSEIDLILEFYRRSFRLEELGELFRLEIVERKSGQVDIAFEDLLLVFSPNRRFLVLYYLPEDECWGREHQQPYPETMGEFIDSCWSLGITLERL